MIETPPTHLFWDWYKYHEDQRLKGFNFFIIFAGASFAFLTSGTAAGHPLLVRVVPAVGALVSVTFFLLEVRNTQLVDIGLDAIRDDYTSLAEVVTRAKHDPARWGDLRLWQENDAVLTRFVRHRFILRSIVAVIGALFVVIAITGPG